MFSEIYKNCKNVCPVSAAVPDGYPGGGVELRPAKLRPGDLPDRGLRRILRQKVGHHAAVYLEPARDAGRVPLDLDHIGQQLALQPLQGRVVVT